MEGQEDERIDGQEGCAADAVSKPDDESTKPAEVKEGNAGERGEVVCEQDAPVSKPDEESPVGCADDQEAGAPSADAPKKKVPVKTLVAAAVVALITVAGIAGWFIWHLTNYANAPDVIGDTPSAAAEAIEGISEKWSAKYVSADDISLLSEGELDEKYEVASIEPGVGEELERNASQVIELTLEKNAETLEAERRQAIIQAEIDATLDSEKVTDASYADEGDVVLIKVVCDYSIIAGDMWPSPPSLYFSSSAEPSEGRSDEDIYNAQCEMAEELESNIVRLRYTGDGYIDAMVYSQYSAASDESIERVATVCEDAAKSHMQHVANSLDDLLNEILDEFSGFSAEYSVENGEVSFYIYGSGITYWGEDISNSSARIEAALNEVARLHAQTLRMPVSIKFVKNGALFASTTAGPESQLYQP